MDYQTDGKQTENGLSNRLSNSLKTVCQTVLNPNVKQTIRRMKKGGLSPPSLLARHFDAFKLAALIYDPRHGENFHRLPAIFIYISADSLREIIAIRDRIVVVLSNRCSV